MFGSGFSAMVILMLIQELCFMAFTTNLQRLNPDLSNVKLDSTFASTAALSVEEGDLARFKIGFLKTWQLQKKIHRRIAIPYTVFWVCQLAALPWSVISLSQGFAADFSDERLERLRQHQHLQVHSQKCATSYLPSTSKAVILVVGTHRKETLETPRCAYGQSCWSAPGLA